MKGALFYLAVGGMEVGAFIDTEGRKMMAIQGFAPIGNLEKVMTAMASVSACIEHADPMAEILRTEPLFVENKP